MKVKGYDLQAVYRQLLPSPPLPKPRSSLLTWLSVVEEVECTDTEVWVFDWQIVNLVFDIKTNLVRHGRGCSRRKKILKLNLSVGGRRLIRHKGFTLSLLPSSFMWHWRTMNSDAQVMIQSIHIKFLIYLNHMYLLPNSYGYQSLCTHLICYR